MEGVQLCPCSPLPRAVHRASTDFLWLHTGLPGLVCSSWYGWHGLAGLWVSASGNDSRRSPLRPPQKVGAPGTSQYCWQQYCVHFTVFPKRPRVQPIARKLLR